MKKLLFIFSALFFLASCSEEPLNYVKYVDPLIGSGGHGHVFVGANIPNGMVQLGPVGTGEGWDWCSGYHISDTTVIGFAHTHLSGTGIGDKGDIIIQPINCQNKKFVTTYSRKNEFICPGYYEVLMDNGIRAKLTATSHVGYHQYYFPENCCENPKILINLKNGIGWDALASASIEKTGKRTIIGKRLSKGWAEDDRVFFAMNLSSDIISAEYLSDTVIDKKTGAIKQINDSCYLILTFDKVSSKEPISIQVGISGVDTDGAVKNLAAEGNRKFDDVRKEGLKKWDEFLSKIDVKTNDPKKLKIFYTALYHAGFFPCYFSDIDNRYRGADGETHSSDMPQVTIMSLWDTYRAENPLYTIIDKKFTSIMVNSMLNIYDQQGSLPVWHLAGSETFCMPGVSSVQIIGDAIMKGIEGFDYERAYQAMRSYADLDYRGLKFLKTLGYLPADSMNESVARALEYCVSDGAISAVAEKLGHKEDAEYFYNRSQNYKKYFDPSDRFMKALVDSTTRRSPFDPTYSKHNQDDYCEGNGWQYTWFVPCDFEGLISLFPTKEAAEAKLDSLFTVPYVAAENASPDISGMIGQYAHGNEPSHSTIFAYCFMGKPEKTAKLARYITTEMYTDLPDGQPGNEDCGQMSAWYILNAMGFYQPNPWDGKLYISSPIFDAVTIKTSDTHSFTIVAQGYDNDHCYHTSATLDGEPFTEQYFTYDDMEKHDTLFLKAQ